MSSNIVRYVGGAREETAEEEEDDAVYANVEIIKETAGNQVVQRPTVVKRSCFRACAVCVPVLCVLLAAGIIAISMYYHSAITELQKKYDNLTVERDQLQVMLCPSGWMKFGDSCYYRSAATKTWEDHRALCQNAGADLVIINSKEEQEFINDWIHEDKHGSWLGLKRTAGKWNWVDGTPLTTQYWDSGFPLNNKTDNCAVNRSTVGGWINADCVRLAFRMCEK